MKRFGKILSPNDLGLTGSHQAGLFVPKHCELITLIPKEALIEENPRVRFAPFCRELDREVSCSLIYYNNRLRGGTRDEFRLTGVTWLRNALFAQPGDVLEFLLENMKLSEVALTREGIDLGPIPWTSGWSPKGWRT